MIFTDKELSQLRDMLETQSGLKPELLQRCGSLIHTGKFDEAVRSAFVLLEEQLRNAVNQDGMTGTRLANYAFSPENGPLAHRLQVKDLRQLSRAMIQTQMPRFFVFV